MQVDEKPHVRLDWCPVQGQYQATHALIGKHVLLPKACVPYQLGFDEEGSCFFKAGDIQLWGSEPEVFGATVLVKDDKELLLVTSTEDATQLQQQPSGQQ